MNKDNFFDSICTLKGVGQRLSKYLKKRKIEKIKDIILNLPYSETDRSKIVKLNDPWGSSFINDNELIITEKSGKIKIIDINSQKISDVEHNLNYLEHGQGGLLDILYKNNFIYISY